MAESLEKMEEESPSPKAPCLLCGPKTMNEVDTILLQRQFPKMVIMLDSPSILMDHLISANIATPEDSQQLYHRHTTNARLRMVLSVARRGTDIDALLRGVKEVQPFAFYYLVRERKKIMRELGKDPYGSDYKGCPSEDHGADCNCAQPFIEPPQLSVDSIVNHHMRENRVGLMLALSDIMDDNDLCAALKKSTEDQLFLKDRADSIFMPVHGGPARNRAGLLLDTMHRRPFSDHVLLMMLIGELGHTNLLLPAQKLITTIVRKSTNLTIHESLLPHTTDKLVQP